MDIINWTGILGAVIIMGAFFIARANLLAFALVSLFAACLPLLLDATYSPSFSLDEKVVLIVALSLFATGLAFVRVVVIRSVSLRLLLEYASGSVPSIMEDDIAHRLEEVTRYRLARKEGPLYVLTVPGKIAALIMSILYHLTGNR